MPLDTASQRKQGCCLQPQSPYNLGILVEASGIHNGTGDSPPHLRVWTVTEGSHPVTRSVLLLLLHLKQSWKLTSSPKGFLIGGPAGTPRAC